MSNIKRQIMSNMKGQRIPELRSIETERAETMRLSFVATLMEKATISSKAKRARWGVQKNKIREIGRSRTSNDIEVVYIDKF
jgi:hypothetical protein